MRAVTAGVREPLQPVPSRRHDRHLRHGEKAIEQEQQNDDGSLDDNHAVHLTDARSRHADLILVRADGDFNDSYVLPMGPAWTSYAAPMRSGHRTRNWNCSHKRSGSCTITDLNRL
jgi:hypothetical protein